MSVFHTFLRHRRKERVSWYRRVVTVKCKGNKYSILTTIHNKLTILPLQDHQVPKEIRETQQTHQSVSVYSADLRSAETTVEESKICLKATLSPEDYITWIPWLEASAWRELLWMDVILERNRDQSVITYLHIFIYYIYLLLQNLFNLINRLDI